MKINMETAEHLMRIDCTMELQGSDGRPAQGFETEISLLFNDTVISSKEVVEVLTHGNINKDPRVIVTTQRKADAFIGRYDNGSGL